MRRKCIAHLYRFPDQHCSDLETCNFGPIDTGPLAEAVAEVYLVTRWVRSRNAPPRPRLLSDHRRMEA